MQTVDPLLKNAPNKAVGDRQLLTPILLIQESATGLLKNSKKARLKQQLEKCRLVLYPIDISDVSIGFLRFIPRTVPSQHDVHCA